MEAAWNTKKRAANTAVQKSILVEHEKEVKTLTGDELESYYNKIKQQKKNSNLQILLIKKTVKLKKKLMYILINHLNHGSLVQST